jgi:hypothetical protein
MYPIVKRKRVPRGVERLRDRRWPKRVPAEVLLAVVQDAAARENTAETEGNKGNQEETKKIPGKPFQPRPKE